jgi:acetyl-CoA acyltransferase
MQEGVFRAQIVPVEVLNPATNTTILVSEDEGVRPDTSLDALDKLKPPFKLGGLVTAGTSSQMSDGAAALVMTSDQGLDFYGGTPLGRFVSYASVGVPPEIMGIGPAYAIPKALKLAGLSIDDIGALMLNEAFAGQSVAVIEQLERDIGLDPRIVNPNGGAIGSGHPLGASSAIRTVELLYHMIDNDIEWGICAACVGGGMGFALVVQNGLIALRRLREG